MGVLYAQSLISFCYNTKYIGRLQQGMHVAQWTEYQYHTHSLTQTHIHTDVAQTKISNKLNDNK